MFVFDHVGVTTTEPQAGENWVEQSRAWVTNPRNHPEHIEFLRYAAGTTVPEVVRANPHVAYRVEAIEPQIEGQEVLIPPIRRRRLRARRLHSQAWNGLRIHAVSERELVRRLRREPNPKVSSGSQAWRDS
jgi:hypothetical protein